MAMSVDIRLPHLESVLKMVDILLSDAGDVI